MELIDMIILVIVCQVLCLECLVLGKVLFGNIYNSFVQEFYFVIVADSIIYDEKLGDSYCRLIVFNSSNCECFLE